MRRLRLRGVKRFLQREKIKSFGYRRYQSDMIFWTTEIVTKFLRFLLDDIRRVKINANDLGLTYIKLS